MHIICLHEDQRIEILNKSGNNKLFFSMYYLGLILNENCTMVNYFSCIAV